MKTNKYKPLLIAPYPKHLSKTLTIEESQRQKEEQQKLILKKIKESFALYLFKKKYSLSDVDYEVLKKLYPLNENFIDGSIYEIDFSREPAIIDNNALLNFGRSLQYYKNLEELNIAGQKIGSKGFKYIISGLAENKSIKIVDFSGNDINAVIEERQSQQEGATVIQQFLERHKKLSSINLSNNDIGTEGLQFIVPAISENTSLTYLNLSHNGIESALEIAKILPSITSLTHLDLSRNNIVSLSGLAVSLTKTKLRVLDLSSNKIEQLAKLAESLPSITSLTHLDLRDNKIENIIDFFSYFAKNQSIKYLDLSGNNIGDDGAKHMADMLKYNSTIKIIKLSDNHEITDKGITAIIIIMQTKKIVIKTEGIEVTDYRLRDQVDSLNSKNKKAIDIDFTLSTKQVRKELTQKELSIEWAKIKDYILRQEQIEKERDKQKIEGIVTISKEGAITLDKITSSPGVDFFPMSETKHHYDVTTPAIVSTVNDNMVISLTDLRPETRTDLVGELAITPKLEVEVLGVSRELGQELETSIS